MSVLRAYIGGRTARQARDNALGMVAGQQPQAPMGGDATTDVMRVAGQALGLNETEQNAALKDYLATGGQNIDPATRAWCADFVNATLAKTGMKGTGSGMARSFLEWGQEVDQPQRGDIAVFTRGDPNGPFGHVGFFDGYNEDGTIRVLGGNQGDSVSIASYPAESLLGFRRAGGNVVSEQPPYPPGFVPMTGPHPFPQYGNRVPSNPLSIFAGM